MMNEDENQTRGSLLMLDVRWDRRDTNVVQFESNGFTYFLLT